MNPYTTPTPALPLISAVQAVAWAILEGPEENRPGAAEALAQMVRDAV